jgi:hypothetical protein
MKKNLFFSLVMGLLLVAAAQPCLACFDTYAFLQKQGMVYPRRLLALESNGEYIIGDLSAGEADMFSGNLNVYYGLANRFSVQASLASAEKERTQFAFDEWGVRGVYGIVQQYHGVYNLDLILEHRVSTTSSNKLFEVSAPNIWNLERMTVVAHPVVAFSSDEKPGPRGHGGVFYRMGKSSIVGLGAEYESAQSSANFGRRLVRGEAGTSLFLGSQMGPNFFVQNELIKGWGAGGNDVGFALTFKVLIPHV